MFSGCATRRGLDGRLADENTMAALWFQHAAECRALFYQACNVAHDVLTSEAPKHTNVAIVVDIDETVLDNSPYQARLIQRGEPFRTDTWHDWVQRFRAQALPGVVALLNDATNRFAANRLEVFYLSNRTEDQREATLLNLQHEGFPNADSQHLKLRTNGSSKEARRQEITNTHHIVLLMGDNLGDFAQDFDVIGAPRTAATDAAREEFGRRFIVLPNPMYGDWEKTFYESKATAKEKLRRRREAVDGY
ncbi:MAG TPA: 5'-nucleotidase, lipoprotein e(P4) family [Candidatus Limnocylindria bacterium]|nr:5'-nucleotidase, lipoprotein e(P4) family [Candidatus Limnocylindria bacterium]